MKEPSNYHTQFRNEQVHPSAWIAEGAIVVGDVTLEMDVSIWFHAVLRGDTESLSVGAGSNLQDHVVVHADPGFPAIIGEYVTVGHGAIVHGARVGNNTVVGMGAILLNGAEVGENCIVGAGALLTQGKVFPANSLILGNPAKVVRELSDEEIKGNQKSALEYIQKARAFRTNP